MLVVIFLISFIIPLFMMMVANASVARTSIFASVMKRGRVFFVCHSVCVAHGGRYGVLGCAR